MNLHISAHAQQRAAQRNLTESEILYIVKHGHRVHRTGRIFCQLRSKDVPTVTDRFAQLIGSTVLLCKCGHSVITVYRNENAFKKDRSKRKYNFDKSHLEMCPICNPDEMMTRNNNHRQYTH